MSDVENDLPEDVTVDHEQFVGPEVEDPWAADPDGNEWPEIEVPE